MKNTFFSLFLLSAGLTAGYGQPGRAVDLDEALLQNQLSVVGRTAVPLTDGSRKGIRLSEGEGEGLVWIKNEAFSTGTIEWDVRGKDVFQRSFVGVAFHGQNDSVATAAHYEAVYFRPFNFYAKDSARYIHAVQYVAHPGFPWKKLRDERNGQFEKAIPNAPDPNGWFHARVEVTANRVRVFVADRPAPVLDVPRLGQYATGKIGLFTGDGSGGDFANVVISENPVLTPAAEFAAKLKQQANPQIIDARSAEEFALNHIDKAINVTQNSPDYNAQVNKLDKSRPVFVYSIQNGRSSALSKDLRSRGFAQVYELEKGIGSWVGGGYPLYTTATKKLTLANYQQLLVTNKVVLVDVGSRYCGSCKRVKPILEALRAEHGNGLKVVELDLEEHPALIASLKTVTAFPYLILYKQGEVVWKRAGITDLKQQLDEQLAKVK